ncbi:MAG TPA: mannitol dehydrogenase family protein [Woeseiaceae bacterium]|nr:mannitol dehydrogenase family protein [Woeseiaceae bacterium]
MTLERLSSHTVGNLAPDVRRPRYDREKAGVGIVHLGVGAFMRSHVAVYCDDAMESPGSNGGDWAIAGVSLRRPDVRDRLAPQDGLYTVGELDATGERRRLIGALKSMHVGPEDPSAVVRRLADPAVRVITLTVTEKGYCLDPDSGELSLANPDIQHDLNEPQVPRSTIGFLTAGLKRRMTASAVPPTIISCDNLPGNGRRLRAAVLKFAAEADRALAAWIADNVAFPATMVDRIVPAAAPEDIERNAEAIGLRDEGFVKTEPYRQWVIEDDFANDRPHWEAGGASIVPDVEPFETAKLRLLNGPHSTIAYLGSLAGFEYVHEAMRDVAFATFIRRLMTEEIAPVTPEPAGLGHDSYIRALLTRFANPALEHRTRQIAMDGSQKLPQRLLNTVRAQLERDGPIDRLSLAIAAWIRYCLGRDEQGRPYDVDDPLALRFADIPAKSPNDPATITAAFLSIREVFGTDVSKNPRFRSKVTEALDDLLRNGASATVGARIAHDAT